MTEEEIEAFLRGFESFVTTFGPDGATRQLTTMVGEDKARQVRKAWEKKVGIIRDQAGPSTLKKGGLTDWYTGSSEDDRFWPALRRHLIDNKGWSRKAVDSIDAESTGIMRLLPYPGGPVKAKGLVVGYVQSGKTANYTALIAKAADVGYRLIVVLAGIHNGLRQQTQERLEAELVSVNDDLKSEWHTLTQRTEDFRARGTNTDAFLSAHSSQRILLVVKKNAHVLGRLVKWLNAAQPRLREQCPALIIDDEADQAGLNTGKNKRSAINAHLLALLAALPKSAYVGYTATPFANVLVDPSGEDLYPEDFIVSLKKPEGYFGTELFFGRDALESEDVEPPPPPDMFREVADDELPLLRPMSKSGIDSFVPGMPDSLKTAVRYFLLATAARWVRGHRRKHSSMLVHTALNPSVHKLLAQTITDELQHIKRNIRTPKLRNDLEALWAVEHPKVPIPGLSPVPFSDVCDNLKHVVQNTKVVEDNGQSQDRLVYKEELRLTDEDAVAHIAVGGNTLSRGLTLEGLVVSYFVRSSSTYDTLLQMGRWFGYRFGYQDLPRIWMTRQLQNAFHDLATVEHEIRQDIARYAEDGLTPKQFAVRIRTHPNLAITSRLKMQYAVKGGINYAGLTRQTTRFYTDDSWLQANWNAGGALLDEIRKTQGVPKKSGRYAYYEYVPAGLVLKFIKAYQFHEEHDDLQPSLLQRYIDAQVKQGRCTTWTICVAARDKPDPRLKTAELGGVRFNLINRSLKRRSSPESVDLGTMSTQSDFTVGLGGERTAAGPKQEKSSRKQVNRPKDSQPLLLLYPVSKDSLPAKPTEAPADIGVGRNVLGVAFAFPETTTSEVASSHVEYVHVKLPDYMDEEEAIPEEDDG